MCPYNQVGQAVAVDIAGSGDAEARVVVRIDADYLKALRAERPQVHCRQVGLAEHHVALTDVAVVVRIGPIRPDNQIG